MKVYYEPTCRFGFVDCILDPAYTKACYPNWRTDVGERPACDYCTDGSSYDDEDK